MEAILFKSWFFAVQFSFCGPINCFVFGIRCSKKCDARRNLIRFFGYYWPLMGICKRMSKNDMIIFVCVLEMTRLEENVWTLWPLFHFIFRIFFFKKWNYVTMKTMEVIRVYNCFLFWWNRQWAVPLTETIAISIEGANEWLKPCICLVVSLFMVSIFRSCSIKWNILVTDSDWENRKSKIH